MNLQRLIWIGSITAVILFLAALVLHIPRGARNICVTVQPQFERSANAQKIGYEFLDLGRGEVWATSNYKPAEFAAFSFPVYMPLWRKNDPRTGLKDAGSFMRSPGCNSDGQFTYMRLYDKEFLQVVKLKKFLGSLDEQGLIYGVQLEKYHALKFNAGRSVQILSAPDGKRYIAVSRTSPAPAKPPTVPEGWSLQSHQLDKELQVNLFGTTTVLRLDNKDSYQGPIADDILR